MSADVNPGEMYRTARERIGLLVAGPDVDPDQAVPATPGWTVREVVAHVSGVAHDAVTGNMDGAPGDAWTSAQVERAKGMSIADLLAQWALDGPILDQVFSGANGGMMSAGVFDVHTHEADLRHALGLPMAIPPDFLAWAGPQMEETFYAAVEAEALPPVQLPITATDWFRGRLGRRTEAEVRAFAWSADPSPYLEAFFIFGRAVRPLEEAA